MTQSKIVAKIRKLGYKVTVLSASHRNRGGIPDVLISWGNKPLFCEIKIIPDKLSKLQLEFGSEFRGGWMCLRYYEKDKDKYSATVGDGSIFEFASDLLSKLNAN